MGLGGEGGREDRAVAAAGRRLAAFEALRAVLAPAVETLLLMDQLLFMQAGGHRGPAASRHHPIPSHPIPVPSDPSCTYPPPSSHPKSVHSMDLFMDTALEIRRSETVP